MSHPLRASARPYRRKRIATIAAVATAMIALAACGSSSNAAPDISGGSELDAVLPARIADMSLVNQDGKTVHLSDFKGKTIVIQDSMTLCQEQCPIDTATFVGLARAHSQSANAKNVVFLTVTVDPTRDDPAQLKAYRDQYSPGAGSLPQWQLITGSASDIAAFWKYFHVYIQKVKSDDVVHNWRTGAVLTYDINHSDEVFFIDGNLQQRYLLDGMPALNGTIPAEIRHFMSAEGVHNMTGTMSNWTVPNGLTVLDWMAKL